MAKPKYFKFSFPSGDPTGIARCAYDKAAEKAIDIPFDVATVALTALICKFCGV